MAPPIDPRLLRRSPAARRYVATTVALGVATTALVLVQCTALARTVAAVAQDGAGWPDVGGDVAVLAAALALRAVVVGTQERFAHRAATRTTGELRAALVSHAAALGRHGPGGRAPERGAVATAEIATRGLEALDAHLAVYLPQLVLAAVVPPVLIAVMLATDVVAGLTVALTLPLVPLFMALVGMATRSLAARRLERTTALGEQVLDLVAGLPTLRALGRAEAQAGRVRAAGEAQARATSQALRTAFLSSLVLELLATLSVALVAVGVGLRLVSGSLDLQDGLLVLLLAPEVFWPLRRVGAAYHAGADGVAAAAAALAVLDLPLPHTAAVRPAASAAAAPSAAPRQERGAGTGVELARLEGLGVRHPGREQLTPAGLDLSLVAGRTTALVGVSGCGKSSAVAALLGLVPVECGRVVVGGHDLAAAGPDELAEHRSHVAWIPQRPVLVPGTLAENALLTSPLADRAALDRAARAAGLGAVVAERGWDAPLGQGGTGLSAGQRQRLALVRVLLRVEAGARIVLLDEPTAHLDAATEALVLTTVRGLAATGCAVLLVAHRAELLASADVVAHVSAGPAAGGGRAPAATPPVDRRAPAPSTGASSDDEEPALC